MLYHEIKKSVTVIQRLAEAGPVPHGTGFFVSAGERIYLISCLHVLEQVNGGRRLEGRVEEAQPATDAVILKLRTIEDHNLSDYRLELSDSSGLRRWRTFLQPENYWDVAVIELERRDLSAYDVRPWKEEEFLSPNTNLDPSTEVFVLTFPRRYGHAPTPYDVGTQIDMKENQVFACDRGAIITEPLYHGASGSPLYRTVGVTNPSSKIESGTSLQIVGIFTGALPPDEPTVGHFHYVDTAAKIMHARRDCLNRNSTDFRS